MHQTFVILSLLLDSVRKLPIVVAHPELDVDIKILEMNLAQSIKVISENSLDNNEFKKRMRELKTDFAKIARSV